MGDKDEKADRLAAALRANLKRRKAQVRDGEAASAPQDQGQTRSEPT